MHVLIPKYMFMKLNELVDFLGDYVRRLVCFLAHISDHKYLRMAGDNASVALHGICMIFPLCFGLIER